MIAQAEGLREHVIAMMELWRALSRATRVPSLQAENALEQAVLQDDGVGQHGGCSALPSIS